MYAEQENEVEYQIMNVQDNDLRCVQRVYKVNNFRFKSNWIWWNKKEQKNEREKKLKL